jgi:hypothetical protein
VKNHVISRALVVFGVSAALTSFANASITSIWRWDSAGGSLATTLTQYSGIATLATGSGTGTTAAISPNINNNQYRYAFGDFTQSQTTAGYIYLTNLDGGGNNMVSITRYLAKSTDALGNFRTNTGGTTFNFSFNWNKNDDVYNDGTYFYRNYSGSGSTGSTRYSSFSDLMSNTNGTFFTFSTTYNFNDRFFGFEGKIYRTNTGGPGGSVNGFATYNNFAALVSGTVALTTNSSNWSAGDMFIAVPTPGAMALVGLAGLVSRRRKA